VPVRWGIHVRSAASVGDLEQGKWKDERGSAYGRMGPGVVSVRLRVGGPQIPGSAEAARRT